MPRSRWPWARACLRAFLGERADDAPLAELLDRAADGLLARPAAIAGSGVAIAIEPHDDFLASAHHRAAAGAYRWARHRGHLGRRQYLVHWVSGPELGLDLLRPWLRYIQVKDGTGRLPDWHLTRIGAGEVPIGDALAWLVALGHVRCRYPSSGNDRGIRSCRRRQRRSRKGSPIYDAARWSMAFTREEER